MKYKILTDNDTGDQEWKERRYIYAESDEDAENKTRLMWLENKLGAAVTAADLYSPDGHIIQSFG